jgi:hypothetical protein
MPAHEFGQVVVQRITVDTPAMNPDWYLNIVRADRHVLISDELLHEIEHEQQHEHAFARLDLPERAPSDEPADGAAYLHAMQTHDPLDLELALLDTRHRVDAAERSPDEPYEGALLTLTARNRTVKYRIGRQRLDLNAWEGSWLD